MEKAFPQDYTPHALMATVLIMEENKKSESGRDYKQAYKEYQTAKGLLKSTDDQTQMQQLEGLIDQLRSGGWIN
jgi:flagellar biosynthesis chaperone FliJ